MSRDLLRKFYLILDSTRIKDIEQESRFLDISWIEVLGIRLSKIDELIHEPLRREYFFPSELKKMEKKLMDAKRFHAAVICGKRRTAGALSKNTKRKLCRIRSLMSFVSFR